MSITLPAGVAQQAFGVLTDGLNAYASGFSSLPADAQVVIDGVGIAASFGVPGAAIAVELEPLIMLIVANNQSATSGSLTRVASGARGSAAQSEQRPEIDE